jgi:hypothetical protein
MKVSAGRVAPTMATMAILVTGAAVIAPGTAEAWQKNYGTLSPVLGAGQEYRLANYTVNARNASIHVNNSLCEGYTARWRKNNTLSPDTTITSVSGATPCSVHDSPSKSTPTGSRAYHGDYTPSGTGRSQRFFSFLANGNS